MPSPEARRSAAGVCPGVHGGPDEEQPVSAPGGKPWKGTYPVHLGEEETQSWDHARGQEVGEACPAQRTAAFSPPAVALGTSGPPAARRPTGSRPLPVVPHGDYEEKQKGGALNRGQKKEVVIQTAAVDVAWGETGTGDASAARRSCVRCYLLSSVSS